MRHGWVAWPLVERSSTNPVDFSHFIPGCGRRKAISMWLACSVGAHLPHQAWQRSVALCWYCGKGGGARCITRLSHLLSWITELNLTGVYPCVCRTVRLSANPWRLQSAGTRRYQLVAYFIMAVTFKGGLIEENATYNRLKQYYYCF